MFGYVTANYDELDKALKERYRAVYCGICRDIHRQTSNLSRIVLSYDMAFLALLLMSLYEPEETQGKNRCLSHPMEGHPWTDNPYVSYAADMNVALAYYKALDDYRDEGKLSARLLAGLLEPYYADIRSRCPRQCEAIERCITKLSEMEKAGEENPDHPAAAFGELMAELMVYEEDLWAQTLRRMGFHLGRFVYLVDAMLDYDRDKKQGSYNPFITHEKNLIQWEEYLVLSMTACTDHYEKLPLVQDKALLDNILYSGVWVQYRGKIGKEDHHGSGSL